MCLACLQVAGGAVITIDAMRTQHDTAQVLVARQADYVMTVKTNMPTLYRQLKKLPGRGHRVRPARLRRARGPRRGVPARPVARRR
jgi:hypothetical protein